MLQKLIALAVCYVLAGCASTPSQPTAPPVAAPAATTSLWCTVVSTLTTTVRTVYVQIAAENPPTTLSVGANCAIKAGE